MDNSLKKAFIFAVSVCIWGIPAGQSQGQVTHYVAQGGGNIFPYTNWTDAALTITGAVSASSNGDTIWVADGRYFLSTPVSITNGITVSGTNAACLAIVDGSNSVRCFELDHTNAVLANLTVQNGYATDYSGGIDLISGTVTNCTIISNRVDAARADGGGMGVGWQGVLTQSRVLYNSVTGTLDTVGGGVSVWGYSGQYGRVYATEIRGNRAYSSSTSTTNSSGGGIFFYEGGYGESLRITDNKSQGTQGAGGGAMLVRGGLLKGSQIISNEAVARGGGIAFFEAGGRIIDCDVLTNNAGRMGGGLDYFQGGNASGVNCISNSALKGGGASLDSGGAATNCTFIYNSATMGGGIYTTNVVPSAQGILHACIISSNQPENYVFHSTFSQFLEYCLTTPSNAYFNGAGNVVGAPTFLEDGSGRLQVGSLGIDQGGSSGAPRREDLTQDYPADANFDGTSLFDIGAFEFSNLRDSDGTGMPDGWLYRYFGQIHGIVPSNDTDGDSRNNLQEFQEHTSPVNDLDNITGTNPYGLPLGWCFKYFPTNALTVMPGDDADGDGMSNLDEARAGTNPTNAASYLQLIVNKDTSSGSGLRLSWTNAPDRTYHLYSADTIIPTNSFNEIYITTPVPVYGETEYAPDAGHFFRLSVQY